MCKIRQIERIVNFNNIFDNIVLLLVLHFGLNKSHHQASLKNIEVKDL
jgi:hypothetical protein